MSCCCAFYELALPKEIGYVSPGLCADLVQGATLLQCSSGWAQASGRLLGQAVLSLGALGRLISSYELPTWAAFLCGCTVLNRQAGSTLRVTDSADTFSP